MKKELQVKPNIGLNATARKKVTAALQTVLANEVALAQATRAAHWNVVGPNFAALHAMFGSQYASMNETVDTGSRNASAR